MAQRHQKTSGSSQDSRAWHTGPYPLWASSATSQLSSWGPAGTPETISLSQQHVANAPWLRQVEQGYALLVYRNLPPAIVRTPGWYQDPRFAEYRRFVIRAANR